MHLCLFEDDAVPSLRPLVETRAAYTLRLGLRTILETTVAAFPQADDLVLHARSLVAGLTAHHHPNALSALPGGADVLFVNGRFVAAPGDAVDAIRAASRYNHARAFVDGDAIVAAWVPNATDRLSDDVLTRDAVTTDAFDVLPQESLSLDDGDATLVRHPWDLLDTLDAALRRDFRARTGRFNILDAIYDRQDARVHDSAVAVNPEAIYLAPGVRVHPGVVLNAEDGPIYVADDATIFENAVVRGPCAIGPKSQVKTGADLAGTALGYYCKVGGEVHGSILHSLSNKGHTGYLGDSYLGRWCNLGAGTNVSNLRNDYGRVTAYDPHVGDFVDTGTQFAGLFMGDHSKCSIGTTFNTGTIVGTFCNVYDSGFPPRYLPPFSWGSPREGFVDYRLDKAYRVAEAVMARRSRTLTDAHRANLAALFDQTTAERAS